MLTMLGNAFATKLIAGGLNKMSERRISRAPKKKSLYLELFKNPDLFGFSVGIEDDQIVIRIKKNSQNKQRLLREGKEMVQAK